MDSDLTWSDVEDVMEAVSARLLEEDGPLTAERPSKRQRLEPVSVTNPKPAPEALPDVTWSGWATVAGRAQLNSTHGPGAVHGIAQVYAKQQRQSALPREQRSQSTLPLDVELQRLSAMLHLAQGGALRSSGQDATDQLQQPSQQHEAAQPSGGSCSRQPLQQKWPDGLSPTQLMGSQAYAPAVVGAVQFKILGMDRRGRGNRGKEVWYLVQFQQWAAGEEDWVQTRQLRREPGGAEVIAEYERALEAGELDESQQQSQADNPGALARASQQSQQAASLLPAIPELALDQPQPSGSAPAKQPRQRQIDENRQQPVQQKQQQQQPLLTSQPQAQNARDPRLQRGQPVADEPHADQADDRQPAQKAAAGLAAAKAQQVSADAGQSSQADAAAADTEQGQALPHMPPSQPPTDSQWLAAETQTQAPVSNGPNAMDFIPFTQGSQPAKASDGAHRQPLPAQPAVAIVPAAAGPAATAPAPGAAAAAARQPAPAPTAAAAAEPPALSARPAAEIADATAPAAPQMANGQAIPQNRPAASGSDEDSAPPDPRTRRGVQKLLRSLSSSAVSPAHHPPLQYAAQAQPAPAQQQPTFAQAAQPEQHEEQQAVLQHHVSSPITAAARHADGDATDRQHGEPSVLATAVAGSGMAAGASGKAALSSSAISIGSSDEDDKASELEVYLQPDKWKGARITRARKHDDGMVINVVWDDYNFKASVSNDLLKAQAHCRLKLIDFYESKITAVSRKKKKTDVTDEASG